jgi:hypothetical protein
MEIKFKKLLGIILLGTTLYIGCKKEEGEPTPEPEEPKPAANFTATQVADDDPFTYNFGNESTNFSVVRWEFGDDSSSVETSPVHTFLKTGTFTILMRVENSEKYWAQRERIIQINSDQLMEMDTHPTGAGTLDLAVNTDVNLSEVTWYEGAAPTGTPVSNEREISIPVQTGRFDYYTLQGKTPKGSVLQITRLLTDLGIVRDVTADGVLSVSRDNNGGPDGGEGSKKLVDNDIETKFLQSEFSGDLWFQLEFYNPIVLGGYTFTSANDADGRDPLNWRLEASNDGSNWTVLDRRENEDFRARRETRTFTFANSTPYNFYRIYVTAVNSGSLFQLSEWRVLSLPQN